TKLPHLDPAAHDDARSADLNLDPAARQFWRALAGATPGRRRRARGGIYHADGHEGPGGSGERPGCLMLDDPLAHQVRVEPVRQGNCRHRSPRNQALLDDGSLVGFAEEALAVAADPQRL